MTTKATKKSRPQKTKPKASKHAAPDVKALEAAENGLNEVEKIRDIIFGTQMANYEKRFAQLEDRIKSQIDDLRKVTADQFKAIDALMQKNQETLNRDIADEHAQREKAAKALSKEIGTAKDALTASIETLAARQAQDVQIIQEQLTTASGDLTEELHSHQIEAAKNLEQAVQNLEDDKLARQALSHLLLEMADRLVNSTSPK